MEVTFSIILDEHSAAVFFVSYRSSSSRPQTELLAKLFLMLHLCVIKKNLPCCLDQALCRKVEQPADIYPEHRSRYRTAKTKAKMSETSRQSIISAVMKIFFYASCFAILLSTSTHLDSSV